MKEAFELIKERLDAKAKETSRRWTPQNDGDSKFFVGIVEGLVSAYKIVSEVEAEYINKSTEHINKLNGWVDVKDRLPKRRELVLVCLKNGYVGEGHFTQDDFWNAQCRMYENVIAWMPLPLPYQPQKGV